MDTIVTGVIGVDVHAIGNWVLRRSLERAGFKVVSLGTQTTQEEFVRAAVETRADAVLVSSIYGQAYLDCDGLREKFVEAGLGSILLYIGGNLTIGREPFDEVEKKFKELGFDRVYPPDTLPSHAIGDLNEDFAKKKPVSKIRLKAKAKAKPKAKETKSRARS